jgi:hypothetical protein
VFCCGLSMDSHTEWSPTLSGPGSVAHPERALGNLPDLSMPCRILLTIYKNLSTKLFKYCSLFRE